ncbi:hypothetical protein M8C21_018571 [Ambrosia artemisiifolia]|uniref:Protein kinase domain-containing protein n=1 Tax=Ambrosia artemisiifolia TaxID=4212 RepID=A0AAD5C0Q2_AMBAR|nr:hypothetical protein M8C21_018571 [Ambrosia artemisiifolia]
MSEMEKWKHLKIPFSDIKEATRNFQKKIGKGGYGSVYEGKLLVNGSDMKVAVKRSTAISHACGTLGYVEPELTQTSIATRKTDVYSFGMVLFEVLSGRLCNFKYEDGIILTAAVAKQYYASGDMDRIIDPVLLGQMSPNSLRKFSAVAIDCLKAREQRPLMDVVKKELEESLQIQVTHLTPRNSMPGTNLLRIPFTEIKDATKGFQNPIIEGDYGFMYEGELSIHGIYTKVMIKRSSMEFGQGIEEFVTEIQMLSAIISDTDVYDDPNTSTIVETKKADVYSFGVVLFEVLCGRLCNVKYDDGIMLSTKTAKEYYAKGKMDKLIDPILREQMRIDSLRKLSAIAYECLQDLEQRPFIDVVKIKLEEMLKNEVLHWRGFFSRHWYILDVEGILSPETHIEVSVDCRIQ